jgi:hypothetical protein
MRTLSVDKNYPSLHMQETGSKMPKLAREKVAVCQINKYHPTNRGRDSFTGQSELDGLAVAVAGAVEADAGGPQTVDPCRRRHEQPFEIKVFGS